MSEPRRVQVLLKAARLTGGDRNKTYGEPKVNMVASHELKHLFWQHWRKCHPGVDAEGPWVEAIEMALTKLGRIATGQFHEDNYIDAAAYIAIACELAAPSQVQVRGQSFEATAREARQAAMERLAPSRSHETPEMTRRFPGE